MVSPTMGDEKITKLFRIQILHIRNVKFYQNGSIRRNARLQNIAKCDYQENVTTGQIDRHIDRWTDGRTDRRQIKLSLCAAMLRSRHKNGNSETKNARRIKRQIILLDKGVSYKQFIAKKIQTRSLFGIL